MTASIYLKSSRFAVLGCLLLFTFILCGASELGPLSPESLIKEAELFPYEGILPSPDGKWIAYEASDPGKPMQFDYPNQRFAKTGYPMLAGAVARNVWVSNVATGESLQVSPGTGSSWSANWSPDSKFLAFYSDRGGYAALWVWDSASRTARQVSAAHIHSSWWRERPAWSADGKTIVCKLIPEGMTLEDLVKLGPGYPSALPKTKPTDTKAVSVQVYTNRAKSDQPVVKKAEASGELEYTQFLDSVYLSDLARIDLKTGAVIRILKRVRPMWFAYSPDELSLAFLNMDGIVARTQQLAYSITVYAFKEKSTRTLAKGFFDANNLTTRVSWSPDGSRLAYSDTGKTAERACYVVDVKSGSKVKVSTQIPSTSVDFSWGPPLWDRSGTRLYLLDRFAGRLWEVSADGAQTREVAKLPGLLIKDMATAEGAAIYWSPDNGKTAYIRAHDDNTKKDSIYAVRMQTGETAKIYEDDESIGINEMGALTGMPHASSTLVFAAQSAARPFDIWSFDVNTKQKKQLSNLNPQYTAANFGRMRIVDWLSLRGEKLHGALLLPSNFREGERYPLVVWVYGGDMGSDKANRFAFGWGAAFNPHIWASRGYAVLYPDVPGHPGTPVDDVVSAVIPGINKTVELGIVDPERLAVMGQSFGAYNTVSLITRTPIFKAAVATSAPATDLFEGYSRFMAGGGALEGYYEEGQGGMKGTPWEFKTRYYENSPFFFLDRVETPLLLQRGADDDISTASGNIFNALRRLGKDVEFLVYEHEGHVLQQPANVIDFWNRRIEWLERHLKPHNW